MTVLTQEVLPGVRCPGCGIVVQPRLHTSTEWPGESSGFVWSGSLVECSRAGCNFVFLLYLRFTISYTSGKIEKDTLEVRGVWPPPSTKSPEGVPPEIARDYEEAHRCLAMGAYTAAALMARRVVESACIEQGATEGNLAAKITQLGGKGKLHPVHMVSATAARLIGNDAAHLLRDIDREEVKGLFDLLHHLLQDLYTTPLVQRRLQKAREGKPEHGSQKS